MVTTIFNLDDYTNLFRDEAAFQEFVEHVRLATSSNVCCLITTKDALLATLISPHDTQDRLANRIIGRLVQRPGILDRLKERLDSNDLVD